MVRHNPEVYYQGTGNRTACAANNVSLGTPASGKLQRDLANNTLPNFGLITPNEHLQRHARLQHRHWRCLAVRLSPVHSEQRDL